MAIISTRMQILALSIESNGPVFIVYNENWKLLYRAGINNGIRYQRTEDLCYFEPQDVIILRFMISQIE